MRQNLRKGLLAGRWLFPQSARDRIASSWAGQARRFQEFDQDQSAVAMTYSKPDARQSLERFTALRKVKVNLQKSLTPATRNMTGSIASAVKKACLANSALGGLFSAFLQIQSGYRLTLEYDARETEIGLERKRNSRSSCLVLRATGLTPSTFAISWPRRHADLSANWQC